MMCKLSQLQEEIECLRARVDELDEIYDVVDHWNKLIDEAKDADHRIVRRVNGFFAVADIVRAHRPEVKTEKGVEDE